MADSRSNEQEPTQQEIDDAGPDTLRRMLAVKTEKCKIQEQLLKFAGDAMKSIVGNAVAFDDRVKKVLGEVVKQRAK